MAKMRVYELARELNIDSSKDILAYLAEKGMDLKSASSNIDEEAIALVRSHFHREKPLKEGASATGSATKKAAGAEDGEQTDENRPKKRRRPKKKKNITAVFNMQYSKSSQKGAKSGEGASRGNPERRRSPERGRGPFRPGGSSGNRIIKPRPENERTVKPKATRKRPGEDIFAGLHLDELPAKPEEKAAPSPEVKDEVRTAPAVEKEPVKDKANPVRDEAEQKPSEPVRANAPAEKAAVEKPAAERVPEENAKAPAERTAKGQTEQTGRDKAAKAPQAVGAVRGDSREIRSENRNVRSSSDKRQPAGGDSSSNRKRQNRDKNKQRPAGKTGQDKGGAQQSSRQGRGNNKFTKNAPASGDGKGRAKQGQNQSRDNRTGRRKRQDKDLLGKKKEHYVNLEKKTGKKKSKSTPNKQVERNPEEIITLVLPEHITIRELADKMKIQPSAIVKKLFMKGTMVTVNQDIDYEMAEEIALEFNCICEPEEKVDVIEELLREDEEDPKTLKRRPPVVCVMGHVDHGKTSLLDAIRDTRITAREAGGITQKIGAYVVQIDNRDITFLDTPGHEAFTAMRMRGANSTDIAILVVAADDGVMPQTIEAINHAKAADIEIIVAINKIDKPNANVDRVKQELSEYELIPEDWGGSTIFVPVSAHTHEGIEELLEMILLTADVMELSANPKRNARGLVIEAELDKGRGAVATVLVQKGTLKVGDPVAAGKSFGRVRAMIDDNGKNVKKAGPSMPVEILGLSEVPNAGEIFVAMDSEKETRAFANTFIAESKNKMVEESRMKMSLDDLFSKIQAGNLKELNIIVKADVQGSVEAVRQSLEKLSNEEVIVKVIHGGVGSITESDVTLASASNAIIIGFNVRPDPVAKQTAESEGVDIRLYKVIYNAIEDVESAMKGMLEPVFEEKVIGRAQVRQIFKSSDVGNIAGSYILDGRFERNCKCRVFRGDDQIFEGSLGSLKRFKDDVKEVKAGYECGIVVDGFSEYQEEDEIEAYIMVEVPR